MYSKLSTLTKKLSEILTEHGDLNVHIDIDYPSCPIHEGINTSKGEIYSLTTDYSKDGMHRGHGVIVPKITKAKTLFISVSTDIT